MITLHPASAYLQFLSAAKYRLLTRSYYRKESAAVTHTLENSQPIKINIVLIYFVSKCLDYSTVITTLDYVTENI